MKKADVNYVVTAQVKTHVCGQDQEGGKPVHAAPGAMAHTMVLLRQCTCIGRVGEAGPITSRRMAHGHGRCVSSRLGAKKAEEQRLMQTARVANMETVLSLQPCLYPYTTPSAELPLERKEPRPCTVAVWQSGLEALKHTLRSAFAAPQLCDLGSCLSVLSYKMWASEPERVVEMTDPRQQADRDPGC